MPKKAARRKATKVCIPVKKAVELGLRKPSAASRPGLTKILKTTSDGSRLQSALRELKKYRKVKAAKQTCSDMTVLTNQAVRAGQSVLDKHATDMTRAQASSLRKRLRKLETSKGKFCTRINKRIKKTDAAAKRAASMRGRR